MFGTSDCYEIETVLTALGSHAARDPITEALFYRSSVGCVAGLASACGRTVVVKAHQPSRHLSSLRAIASVQTALAADGFPCPAVIAPPERLGPGLGYATFESYLADPGQSSITRKMLGVSARGLARLAAHTKKLGSIGCELAPPDLPKDTLYPPPHSPLFDFEATGEGAEWIDDVAALALEDIRHERSEPHLMHGDWSAANVRLSEIELLAVYDWDSLVFAPLSRAVGVAAATWSAWGETSEPVAPCADEVRRYVLEFERAFGQLSEVQRKAAYAHALYCLAYTARCEHSVDPGGQSHLRARPRLRSEGIELLRQ